MEPDIKVLSARPWTLEEEGRKHLSSILSDYGRLSTVLRSPLNVYCLSITVFSPNKHDVELMRQQFSKQSLHHSSFPHLALNVPVSGQGVFHHSYC